MTSYHKKFVQLKTPPAGRYMTQQIKSVFVSLERVLGQHVLAHNGEAVMGLKMEIIGEYY